MGCAAAALFYDIPPMIFKATTMNEPTEPRKVDHTALTSACRKTAEMRTNVE